MYNIEHSKDVDLSLFLVGPKSGSNEDSPERKYALMASKVHVQGQVQGPAVWRSFIPGFHLMEG